MEFPKLEFDLKVDFILDKLRSYKNDPELMKGDCEKYNITGDPNQEIRWYCDKWVTEYEMKISLKDILVFYNDEDKMKPPFVPGVPITDRLHSYKNHIDTLIEKYEAIKREQERQQKEYEKLLLKDYQKEWQKYGLCPKCKEDKPEDYKTGVVEFEYETVAGVIRETQHFVETKEYQFHYKKCPKCGHWEMYEYRPTPSWWDDLWGLDCPFHKGNIISLWENGDACPGEYIGYKITRW